MLLIFMLDFYLVSKNNNALVTQISRKNYNSTEDYSLFAAKNVIPLLKLSYSKHLLFFYTTSQSLLQFPSYNLKPNTMSQFAKQVITLIFSVFITGLLLANKETTQVSEPPISISHEAWDKLLRQYVSNDGKVNYKGFQQSKANLNAYLDYLSKNPVQDNWSKAEKMAYWINAYNAFTIKLITDNYPLTSITKLHDGKPWDVKWIKLGDKTYTLNNIENDVLRPQFKDARIHFALNCAAKSCPPLLNRAWTAENLNKYLDQQAKAFINNPKFNKISPNEVQLSKIFEWYAGDFVHIIDYLNQYATTKINSKASVKYVEYDWALNE